MCFFQNSYSPRLPLIYWAGELADGFGCLAPEETPPTTLNCNAREGRKARALAPEQKRNVHPQDGDETCQVVEDSVGSGETADLQGERTNRRR